MSLQNEINEFNKKYYFVLNLLNDNINLNKFSAKTINTYLCDQKIANLISNCLSKNALNEFYDLYKEYWYESYYLCYSELFYFDKPLNYFLPLIINNKKYGFVDIRTQTLYYVHNKKRFILQEEKLRLEKENTNYKNEQKKISENTDYTKGEDKIDKIDKWFFRTNNAKKAIKEISLINKKILKNNETLNYINNELNLINQNPTIEEVELKNVIKIINEKCGIKRIVEIKIDNDEFEEKFSEQFLKKIVEIEG